MWLTKAVDISVSYLVHVVVYTVPSLRRPPVLLVRHRTMRRREIADLTLFLPSGIYDHLSHIIQCPRLGELVQIIRQL